MPRKRWIKFWTQETLYGTTSKELLLDEQACWFKLLCLAGDSPDPGKVELAPGIPMTDSQIAGIMNAPLEIWLRTKDRLSSLDVSKIYINEGIIHITNWDKYQGDFDRAEYMRNYMQEYRKRQRKTNSKPANGKSWDQTRTEGRGTEISTTTGTTNKENVNNFVNTLAQISQLYEGNIGMLTPAIAEGLKDIAEEYPAGWFDEALKEAVRLEHRSLKYIVAILERWKVDGFKSRKSKTARLPNTKDLQKGWEA